MKEKRLWSGYQRRMRRFHRVNRVLAVLVFLFVVLALCVGSVSYSGKDVLKALFGAEIPGVSYAVSEVRLPRMLGGALAGAAFGMAGYCFQTLLRNPLASPDVIGISSGTSTAAVFCILYLKLQGSIVAVIAVVFGILTAVAVYLLASPGGHFSHGKMILTGIGVAALFDAVTSYLLTKTAEFNVSATMQWLSGNLNGVERKDIPLLAIVVLGLGMILCLLERHLQTLGLGDAYAVVLGMNVRKDYLVLILCGVCLVAVPTAVTGPIASVAFLSGPIASRLAGYARANVAPSALTGALLVLASDFIGCHVLPVHYPVGVITGLLGAPYMLYLLIAMNKKGEF